eukprot:4491059-Amphidinium_carterae.1
MCTMPQTVVTRHLHVALPEDISVEPPANLASDKNNNKEQQQLQKYQGEQSDPWQSKKHV